MTIVAKLHTRPGPINWETLEREETNIVDTIPVATEEGLWFELRLVNPASMQGRRAVLVIPPEQLDGVLKAVRSAMIAQRRRPLEGATS